MLASKWIHWILSLARNGLETEEGTLLDRRLNSVCRIYILLTKFSRKADEELCFAESPITSEVASFFPEFGILKLSSFLLCASFSSSFARVVWPLLWLLSM